MKNRIIYAFLLILLFAFSHLTAEQYYNLSLEENNRDSTVAKAKGRSNSLEDYKIDLGMGYFMAVVPGFFVHGAGNLYGGNDTRGLTLLGIEAASMVGILIYGLADLRSADSNTDVSTSAYIVGAASVILFIGSWWWDIATVGDAIKKRHSKNLAFDFGRMPQMDKQEINPRFGITLGVRF